MPHIKLRTTGQSKILKNFWIYPGFRCRFLTGNRQFHHLARGHLLDHLLLPHQHIDAKRTKAPISMQLPLKSKSGMQSWQTNTAEINLEGHKLVETNQTQIH